MMALAFQFRHDLVCLFRHLLVNVLSQLVIFVDMLGCLLCGVEILLHQQVNRLFTVLHSSRRIDARTDFEDDVTHRNLAVAKPTDVDDSFQTGTWVLVQLF